MNNILLVVLFLLLIYVSGKNGIKLFFSLILNFILLMFMFVLISLGINSVIVTILVCLGICYISLYMVNGKSIKTYSSFISIFLVLVILTIGIYFVTKLSRIAGFGYESYESINMFSYNVRIDFTNISISLILIGLIGAIIDSSMAISSALYEIYLNNKKLSSSELFRSGMNIGKDILGTTVNTLLFAFLGEFMALLIWYKTGNYSFLDIINNKTFCSEVIKILSSAIGCLSVIPLTSLITSKALKNNKLKREYGTD